MKATRTKTIIPFRLWVGAGMTPVIEHRNQNETLATATYIGELIQQRIWS